LNGNSIIAEIKRCKKCGNDKSVEAFALRSNGNRRSECKECKSATERLRRASPHLFVKIPLTDEERFWSKVDKNGPTPVHCPELGPCWVWTAGCFSDGYGAFRPEGSNNVPAHRYSFVLEYGPMLDDILGEEVIILHACDNPPCIRPSHLYQGITEENVADRQAKGRSARGTQMPQTKLTPEQKQQIRDLYSSGKYTQAEIGAQFNIHGGHVCRVIREK
jgi:hypothetical protein